MKRLFPLALLALATTASATELGGLTVQVDGERKDVGVVVMELTTYRIDLAKILTELTDGHAALKQTGASECRIVVDGEDRLRLPMGVNAAPTAVLAAGGTINLTEAPRFEKLKGGGKRIYLDVRALGQITGVSADLDRRTMAFFTPEWWAKRLGIRAERAQGLNARSVGTSPDFGITPPASTMLAWVRPAKKSYVQIYKGLADGIPAPMLATTPLGKRVVRETESDLPTMWSADADNPAQAPTQHIVGPDGGLAMYAAVVAPGDLGEDAVNAINAGGVESWNVVGMRQRVLDTPLTFRLDTLREGESLGKFASRTRMPVELLLAMNGYGERSTPKAGTRLLVIDKVVARPDRPDAPRTAGLYEVRPGETVDKLAERWGVAPDAVCQLNDIEESQDLDPGQVIYQIAPGNKPPAEKPKIAAMETTGRTKGRVPLRETSAKGADVLVTIPGDAVVSIRGKVAGMYSIQYGTGALSVEGFVPTTALSLQPEAPPISVAQVTSANPRAAAIRTEALAHLGTPYNWGGNDICRGIDCSHFVSAVLTRSGAYAPSPPVSSQEQIGQIVHWKAGAALRGRGLMTFPNAQYPGQPSLDRLQIGDRLIIQHPPIDQRAGGRHTGVYIGPYTGRFGNFKHAVVHAGSHGVAVVSFNAMWRDYRYTVHDGAGRRVASRGTK